MKNITFIYNSIVLFLFFNGSIVFGQETYCSNPIQNNTNTINPISFSTTASVTGYKYFTNGQITASGAVLITGNKRFYSTSRISLGPGFKATSSVSSKFVAAIGPCSTPATKIQDPIVKSESNLLGTIAIYPNPAKTVLNIAYNDVTATSFKISDLTGRLLWEQNTKGINEDSVNIEQFPEGVYSITFFSGENSQTLKFIKKDN